MKGGSMNRQKWTVGDDFFAFFSQELAPFMKSDTVSL